MQSNEHAHISRITTYSSAVVIVLSLWYLDRIMIPTGWHLVWRWPALPLIFSLCITVGVAVMMINRVSIKRGPFYWFLLLLIANIGFLVLLILQALTTDPHVEAFLESALPITWVPTSVILFMFTLSYVTKRDLPLSSYAWGFLLSALIIVTFVVGATDMLGYHEPQTPTYHWWGYSNTQATGGWWIYAWGIILAMTSLVLLIRAFRRESNEFAKRQLRVFIVAISQYLLIAAVFDIFVRLVFPGKLPPFSFIYITLLSLIIGYGVMRYGLFQISPASLSDQILHNLSEAVIGTDVDFGIEFANAGSKAIFGKTADMLSGRRISTLVGEAEWRRISVAVAQSGDGVMFDDIRVIAGGQPVDVMLTVSKIIGEHDKLVGYIFVFQNISELRKKTIELAHEKASVERKVIERTRELHEERARLRASIESLALGFALVDRGGKVLIQNHMLESMLQMGSITSVNDMAQKMHGFALVKYCNDVQETGAPKILKDVTYGEKVLRVFIAGVAAKEGGMDKPIGAVILVEDITEMKVLERSRDEFFSIASHELRTPLTAIRGNASMLLEYFPNVMKDQGLTAALADIHESSVRLIEIVNDFLDLSRLEQKRMAFDFRAVRLDKVIEGVVYEMKASIREKGIAVKFDGMTLGSLPQVWADESRVKQIIYNLVGNATKFTDKGTITITPMVEGSKVKVFVTDTGRGIPVESRKLLFHKFQQAGESILTRDTTRGTGLGLYISKLLVEDMGGRIVLEHSEEGKGSTFSFTLPVATEKQLHGHGKHVETIGAKTA